MKLTFLTGRAGAGKTALVLDRVAKATEALEKTILIVPEQFTFSAERILTRRVKTGGLLFTQVLSPSRLAYRVLTMVGGMKFKRLDFSGMTMAVKKLLIDLSPGLKYFSGAKNIADVAPLMAEMIVKLKQNGLSPAQLKWLIESAADENEKLPQMLLNKLIDIAFIYEEYERLTENEYADEQRHEALLAANLHRADFLREYDVYVDGFDVISPSTIKMLASLAAVAKSMTITFTFSSDKTSDSELFAPVRQAMNSLTAMIRQGPQGENAVIEVKEIDRKEFRSPEIGHLERELFSQNPRPYESENKAIEIFYAPTIEREAVAIASNIIHLARKKGLRYGDMAVICADGGERGEELKRQLDMRGVPCRLDKMESAADHSAVKLIISAMLCAGRNMSQRRDVLPVLKSGWIGLSDDEADLLENYIIENNIRGSWFFSPIDDSELESARKRLVDPIRRLARGLMPINPDEKNAQSYSRAAYVYIENIGLLPALIESSEGQLAQIICDVLDQSHALLGNMNPMDYVKTLKEGFAACKLGSIPHQADCVNIGSPDRFKGDQVKALFVMGMNDGLIPSNEAPESLISDYDAEALGPELNGLGFGSAHFHAVEKLSIYDAFTQAYDYLYLSLSRSGSDGQALEPSSLIKRIESIFPRLKPKDQDYFYSCEALLVESNSAKKMLGLMLRRSFDPGWISVSEYFRLHEPKYMERLDSAMSFAVNPEPINKETARNLFFGAALTPSISISRLESFASCPYKHFLSYGIKPVPREEPEIRPVDRGSFFHDYLETFTRRALVKGLDDLSEDDIRKIAHEISRENIGKILNTPAGKTADGRAAVYLLDKSARRAAENIADHIKKNMFKPRSAEIRFGKGERFPAIHLSVGDMTMQLEGRIDRLDTAILDGRPYARVVDYKSGGSALLLCDIVNGLSLQLLTYLSAVKNGGYDPAGAFYLHVSGKSGELAPSDIKDREKLIERLKRGYRLEGVALKDDVVLSAMSGGEPFENMLNVRIKNDGTPYKNSPVFDEGQMQRLMEYVGKKERELAGQILSGDISMKPVRTKGGNACTYCDHRLSCMFDVELGAGYRHCSATEAEARAIIFGGEEDE
jgi:ATP-dependent helicase/nuclease subunit B